MTNDRARNFVPFVLAEATDVEGKLLVHRLDPAVSQQGFRSERFQVVTSAAAADFVQEIVRRLDIGVRVSVVEVVEDQPSPALLAHVGQHLSERMLQLLRKEFSPAVISLLGLGSGLALVDVVEPLLEQHRLLDRRVALEQGLQPKLVTQPQSLGTRPQQADLVLELDTLIVVDLGLDALPDLGHGKIGVAQDVELIDDDGRGFEVRLVQRLVGPVHVLGDDLNLSAVAEVPSGKVLFKVRLLSRVDDVQEFSVFNVSDDEARHPTKNLLIHAEHPGKIVGIVLETLRGVVLKHSADKTFLHPVDAPAYHELVRNPVLRQLVTEADRHPPLEIDERQRLEQKRHAAAATVPLTLDPQVGFLPLMRVVAKVDEALPVLDHVGIVAFAGRNVTVGVDGLHVDEGLAFDGLRREGEPPLNSQPIHVCHARPLCGGHYRARVTSQLRVAA